MKTKKLKKFRNKVLDNQVRYDLRRKEAYQEIKVLEEYFGKRQIDQDRIFTDILLHLEAAQKELSYTGYRGVVLGLVTAVFLYAFNTQIMPTLTSITIPNEGNYFLNASVIMLFETIVFILFFVIYLIGTSSAFIEDRKRRKQIYINEYLIKLVQMKIKNLEVQNNPTRKNTN